MFLFLSTLFLAFTIVWSKETMGKIPVHGVVIDKESPIELGKYSHVERIIFFKADNGKIYTLDNVEPFSYYNAHKGAGMTFDIWKTEVNDYVWYKKHAILLFIVGLLIILLSIIGVCAAYDIENTL